MTYKIKLFKYKLQANIDNDIPKVVEYFKLHNIDVVFDIQETQVTKDFALLQLMQPNDGTCDVVMYVYDRSAFNAPTNGLAFRVSNTLRGVYLATSVIDDTVDYTWKSICHEIMHTLFMKLVPLGNGNIPMDTMLVGGVWKPYYKNEELDAPDGNFALAWKLLAPYIQPYKYFKMTESTGGGHTFSELDPVLRSLLDKIRGECGFSLTITSGKRTVAQNGSLSDAVSDSAHLSGLAADIACTDSSKRFKLIQVALANGICRYGVGKGFIHIDISKTLPQNVCWEYN